MTTTTTELAAKTRHALFSRSSLKPLRLHGKLAAASGLRAGLKRLPVCRLHPAAAGRLELVRK
jgi:hypothetical protein